MSVNFKRIEELGLETIQLENEVLLVDKTTIELSDWYFNERTKSIARCNEMNIGAIKSMNQDGLHKVCYSTKPLEGLPLLVIEDEVEKWINESTSTLKDVHTINISKMCLNAGYNKARQTYKFTEEDLRKAYREGAGYIQEVFYDNRVGYGDGRTIRGMKEEEFIQSLTKKELWIEVDGCSDCHLNDGYMSSPNCCREVEPKITEGKIKAIWK